MIERQVVDVILSLLSGGIEDADAAHAWTDGAAIPANDGGRHGRCAASVVRTE